MFPKDLSRLTHEQTDKVLRDLARLPLSELRRRQGLVEQQLRSAARYGGNERGVQNLQIMERHLQTVVDRKEFGDEHEPNVGSRFPLRTEVQREFDRREYADTSGQEPWLEQASRDAWVSPGPEPKRFAGAKAKATPQTETEKLIVEEFRSPFPLGYYSNALFYSDKLRYLSAREKQALYSLVKGGAVGIWRTSPANYWLVSKVSTHTPNDSHYYVWVLRRGSDVPLDEGPYGPYALPNAKDYARIGATEGEHDRAVSRGVDPKTASFEIVRRYAARTGERII